MLQLCNGAINYNVLNVVLVILILKFFIYQKNCKNMKVTSIHADEEDQGQNYIIVEVE